MRHNRETWQDLDADKLVEWSPSPEGYLAEGPLDLTIFEGKTMAVVLAADQLAFVQSGGKLHRVYMEGAHRLRVGSGSGETPADSTLVFVRCDVPLTLRWRHQSSLVVDTGHADGCRLPLRGQCTLAITDPSMFHERVLQGLNSLDPVHLGSALDTMVRAQLESRMQTLVERRSLDPVRAQVLLAGLGAADLAEDLAEIGLGCVQLAVFTPAPEPGDRPMNEAAPEPTVMSYDDVF